MNHYHFPQITLLITHYNRSQSLVNLLTSFYSLNCSFGDVIVSDDGSDSDHVAAIEKLQNQYNFQLVKGPVNKGLGNNINKGQDLVRTPYTLYIQEDFQPTESAPEKLKDALQYMEKDTELDLIRFYGNSPYPYLKYFEKGFSKMYIKPLAFKYRKIYYYSDTPHLRRTSFLQKFGRYPEGLLGDRTEYRMCISFIQKQGKGLFYNDCQSIFKHFNSIDEPSTMDRRKSWKSSDNYFIGIIRDVYRQIRYNYDLLMMNPLKGKS